MAGFGGALYVGDLNPDVTEANLFEIFNYVGPVASVRVCRDASSRRSLGYAYVNYHRVEDAEKALDTVNGKLISGRSCRVMWSQRDPSLRKSNVGNIFVKNLASTIDIRILYDTFSMFGNILSCKVVTGKNGESLGYGFVHYETEEAAQEAINKVNGKFIAGQKVEVSPFISKKKRAVVTDANFKDLYVASLPKQTSPDDLSSLFSKFGSLTTNPPVLKVPKPGSTVLYITEDDNKVVEKIEEGKEAPVCYAFVGFETHDQAFEALILDKTPYAPTGVNPRLKLKVARYKTREERERERQMKKHELQMKTAPCNIYVKNIPGSWTAENLKQEFEQFGPVTSAVVEKDANGASRFFGYVCFQNPQDANNAVQNLNGAKREDKELYVAPHQRKDVRRPLLEEQYSRQKYPGFPGYGMDGNNRAGSNIYVKNLPDNIDEAKLKEEFSKFGSVTSVKIPVENGKPKGFGFVCFSNPQEAAEAIANLNGSALNGKHLYVTLHQKKVVRRAFLESQFRSKYPAFPSAGGYMYGMPRPYVYPPQFLRPRWPGQPMPQYFPPMVPQPGQQRFHLLPAAATQQRPPYPAEAAARATRAMRPQPVDPRKARPVTAQIPPPASAQRRVPQQRRPGWQDSLQQLAHLSPAEQKQKLGELLFPKVASRQPENAGKITGMLLEMENGEIVNLLENDADLLAKIQEAVDVLDQDARNHQRA